jgi:hypothetical protein
LDTGIATIDAVETTYSQDMLEYQIQLEDGGLWLKEDTGSIINEGFQIKAEPIDNLDFDNIQFLEGILDFSEKNPFGEIGV